MCSFLGLRDSRMRLALLIVVCTVGMVTVTRAQGVSEPVLDPTAANVPSLDPTDEPGDGTSRKTGRGVTPLIAPVPFKNSQLGWGGVLMLGLIHRLDADTSVKPSTGAIAALASENGSWGVMGMEMARFASDKWRVRGMLSYLDLHYDFYGIGVDAGESGQAVPLDQTLFMAGGAVLRRVFGPLYLGASIVRMETTVALRDSVPGAPAVPNQSKAVLLAPGIQGELDTRDNDYWPYHGSLAELKARFFSTQTGTSGTFQRYQLAWSWFNTLRGRSLVLATNINACAAPGDPPFYGLCALGSGRYVLRGYTQGRYRDHYGNVVQFELRGHTNGRVGGAVFGGFGQVAPALSDIFSAKVLPAGGLGLRFQLTNKYPMHMRLDYAWGRDGGLLYFSVGEAF